MLEQLLQGLQGQVGKEVQDKIGVDSDMMSKIMSIAGGAASSQVSKEMKNGGISTVMNLFSNQENNASANSLQSNITNSIVSSLVEKLGFDNSKASMITSMVLPAIMNMVTQKNSETPDNDSSPIEALFGGQKKSIITSLLGGLFKK